MFTTMYHSSVSYSRGPLHDKLQVCLHFMLRADFFYDNKLGTCLRKKSPGQITLLLMACVFLKLFNTAFYHFFLTMGCPVLKLSKEFLRFFGLLGTFKDLKVLERTK